MSLESANVIECGPHRTESRCVSWSASGLYLAFGSSDRLARLVTVEPTQAREVLVISGHQGAVTHTSFHPTDKTLLCTAALDNTVRIWDCRGATQRDVGSIEIGGGRIAKTVDWCRNSTNVGLSHALVVTEEESRVVVYDTRKLPSKGAASGKSNLNAATLHVSEPQSKEVVKTTLFGPGSGKRLISAAQLYGNDMPSDLCVWDWTKEKQRNGETDKQDEMRFPAHTHAIRTMALSPDGKRLATGGVDAIVGLWDTSTMVCTHTVTRRTKSIRSVAFSHDGKVLANSNDENDVELVRAADGKLFGQVNLGHRRGGADSLAWHPTLPLLACARAARKDGPTSAPVAIAKLNISSTIQ